VTALPDVALLEVEGLAKQFEQRPSLVARALGAMAARVRAVDGVSFAIARGETLGLIGESGCGKSTLGRCVLRLHEPSQGRIRFDGIDVRAADAAALRRLRRRMQIIFQDPYASLNPRMTIGQILAEPLNLHAIVPPARRGALK
jgi:ABC-type glutathione transport system ATPase component